MALKIAGKQKVDIIMLQETWLTQTNCNLVNIPGYKHFFQYWTGRKEGGVSMLVSNELTCKQNENLCHNESYLESCAMEIQLPYSKPVVCSVYQPPNTTKNKFNNLFEKLIKKINKTTKHSLIGLDHNLDLLKSHWHKPTQSFIETVLSNAHIPCITRLTRITKSSATLIDNILISRDIYNSINCGIAISDLSDHFPCIITWPNIIKNKKTNLTFEMKKLDKKSLPEIKKELSCNWDQLLIGKEVNKSYQLFHSKLTQTLDKFTEIKKIKIPYKKIIKEPWLTKGIMNSNKKQLQLYKHWLQNKTAENYDRYKHYRNSLRAIKRRCKINYYCRGAIICYAVGIFSIAFGWRGLLAYVYSGVSNKECIEVVMP